MSKTRKVLFVTTLVLVLVLFVNIATAWTTSDPGYSLEYAVTGQRYHPAGICHRQYAWDGNGLFNF